MGWGPAVGGGGPNRSVGVISLPCLCTELINAAYQALGG